LPSPFLCKLEILLVLICFLTSLFYTAFYLRVVTEAILSYREKYTYFGCECETLGYQFPSPRGNCDCELSTHVQVYVLIEEPYCWKRFQIYVV
jgi:hypothetical protein